MMCHRIEARKWDGRLDWAVETGVWEARAEAGS